MQKFVKIVHFLCTSMTFNRVIEHDPESNFRSGATSELTLKNMLHAPSFIKNCQVWYQIEGLVQMSNVQLESGFYLILVKSHDLSTYMTLIHGIIIIISQFPLQSPPQCSDSAFIHTVNMLNT